MVRASSSGVSETVPPLPFFFGSWLSPSLVVEAKTRQYGSRDVSDADRETAHCDGAYREQDDEKVLKTIFTIHLYLNDSKAEVGEAAELEGGATSFLSNDETKKMDVDPRAGRVLIFQHLGLYHSGDDVLKGIKYTMRTDILYELMD